MAVGAIAGAGAGTGLGSGPARQRDPLRSWSRDGDGFGDPLLSNTRDKSKSTKPSRNQKTNRTSKSNRDAKTTTSTQGQSRHNDKNAQQNPRQTHPRNRRRKYGTGTTSPSSPATQKSTGQSTTTCANVVVGSATSIVSRSLNRFGGGRR